MKEHVPVPVRVLFQLCEQTYFKFITSVLHGSVKRPWMKVREIDLIKNLLLKHEPEKCLEWGTGYSTLFFPKYLPNNAAWLSIEHEKNWFDKINAANGRTNVDIRFVAPNRFPWSDPLGDGSYSDLSDYINYPESFGPFDFILIDGRARSDCLKKASALLSNNGIVVLHDANRKRYDEPLKEYRHQVFFRDYRERVGGLWIGSNALDFSSLIDVAWQGRLWDLYDRIGKSRFGNILRA